MADDHDAVSRAWLDYANGRATVAEQGAFCAGFRAGLAHAQQWRPLTDDTKTLTDDPKTWPEVGWIVVWDARMPTRAKAGRVLSETGTELMRQGWTHWLPLPEPPKGESK